MTVRFSDSYMDVGSVKKTEEGYTIANVKCVRTGIQQYTKRELGFMEDGIVNVYRPPEEVFHKDSIKSFIHKPLTIGHPNEPVTSLNWKDFAVGEVSTDVIRDGEYLQFSLIVKDQAYDHSDFKEISAGYNCDLIAEDGVAPCGTPYQYKQANIRGDHIAFVHRGRAGAEARIGDGALNWGAAPKPKEVPLTELKTVVLGDEAVNLAVADAAKIEKYKSDFAAKLADADTVIGELTAKLADAEAKILSDADIEVRVADRMALVDTARQVMGFGFVADSKTAAQIKREVVAHKFGDAVTADASDAHIEGMFKVATSDAAQVNDTARLALAADAKPIDDYAKRISDAQAKFYKGEK